VVDLELLLTVVLLSSSLSSAVATTRLVMIGPAGPLRALSVEGRFQPVAVVMSLSLSLLLSSAICFLPLADAVGRSKSKAVLVTTPSVRYSQFSFQNVPYNDGTYSAT
jgi:hypothetical protein